jgi:iron complex outermembrane receptor protein
MQMKSANCAVRLAVLSVTFCGVTRAADNAPAPPGAETLPRVVITGTPEYADDYRVPLVNSPGPLGSTPILDTPYSIGILPQALINNSQAVNFKDLSKYLPLVAYQEQQGPDIVRPQTRGMQGGNFQNSRMDGMTMFITVATAMEQFQQIEVLNGPSSALYGPANPSGMFNFITKRPTDSDLRELSATYNSDSIGTVHADLGGKIDPTGILGFRLNALFASGGGYVDRSHDRRVLGDLGVDLRPWQGGVLELNYSDYSLTTTGYPGWFTYGEKIVLPPPPDPERVGYGQSYAGVDLRTRTGTARFKQELDPNWHLVIGALSQDASRNINTPVNNLTDNLGNYVSSFANGFAPRFAMASDASYLNGVFATGSVGHDLTLGTAGYKARSFSVLTPAKPGSVRLGSASIDDPLVFPEPAQGPPNVLANFDSSDTYQRGINASDTIKFTERWLMRIGISQDWIHVRNYSAKGMELPEYAADGLSPTGSIIYKPAVNISTYITYASSLAAGDLAPGTAANAGVGLAPYRSKEYEAGYKATLSNINLTAALFRIERPFANIDPADNIFGVSGLQVNKGVELSAVGEIYRGLTLLGGVTLLDARLEHTPLPTTNDKTYVGAPKVKGNILLEYQLPGIAGLVTMFDYQFSGRRPANDTNSLTAPGYDLFDLGVRYTSNLRSKPLTWRLAVANVTDRHYWSTIAPSNLTGANTGNLLAHLGAPRTVLASVTVGL